MVGSPCKHEDASASINHPITLMDVLRIWRYMRRSLLK
jgi:hypothetical protein